MKKNSGDIGARLRELRRLAGLSQMKVADKVGVSYQQIQKYEKGTSQLSVPRLLQLAEVFGVPFDSIVFPDGQGDGQAVAAGLSKDETNLVMTFRRIRSIKVRQAMQSLFNGIVSSQGKR